MKLLVLFLSLLAAASAQPLICFPGNVIPPVARNGGQAELLADVVLECQGGANNAEIVTDISVTLDGPFTSKLLLNGYVEAALMVNEPDRWLPPDSPPDTALPLAPNVNYVLGKPSGANTVVFRSIRVRPLGPLGKCTIRITNIRGDVRTARRPRESVLIPAQVNATVAATNPNLFIVDPVQTVAYLFDSLNSHLIPQATSGLVLRTCTGSNTTFPVNAAPNFNIQFLEPFQTAWKIRLVPRDLTRPGEFYADESGFYRPDLPPADGMNMAGLATTGTRLSANFSGVPAGASLWIAIDPSHATASTKVRMISSNVFAAPPASVVPAATVTIDGKPYGIVPVTLNEGRGSATWEITGTDPAESERLDFPLFVTFSPNTVEPATVRVAIGFASSTNTTDIPRFVTHTPDTTFVIQTCTAGLPDLTITAIPQELKAPGGTKASLDFTISNLGQAPSGPFRIAADSGQSLDVDNLAAGENRPVRMDLRVFNGPPGSGFTRIWIDSANQVVETDETNNTRLVTITNESCSPGEDPLSGALLGSGEQGWPAYVHVAWPYEFGICATATSFSHPPSASWLRYQPYASFYADINKTGRKRATALVTDDGVRYNIVQMPTPDPSCIWTFRHTDITVPATGATSSLDVVTSTNTCKWETAASADWATMFPESGIGAGKVSYTIAPNFSAFGRQVSFWSGSDGWYVTAHQAGATGTWNERFVQRLYYTFLGRFPTPAELAFQTGELQRGLPPAAMASSFFNSPEFNNSGRFIAGLYVGLLNRDAEYAGWYFQRGAFATSRISQRDLVTNFLNGPEWRLTFGTPDTRAFVRLLYRNILLRDATEPEVDFHAGTISPTGIDRVQFAMNLLNSAEFRNGNGPRLTAFLLYATTLFRDGEADELTSTRTKIQGGAAAQTLMTDLMKSAEFTYQLR